MQFDIPTNMDEITEDKPVPTDRYDVRISKAEEKESKKKNPMIWVFCEVLNGPENASDVLYFLNIPYEGCHEFLVKEFKRFIQTFGIDVSDGRFDAERCLGAEANVAIELEMDDNNQPRNVLKLNPISD